MPKEKKKKSTIKNTNRSILLNIFGKLKKV